MSTTGATCRRFNVTGRVQGVFFRDSARRTAQSLGLTGYARNLDDGSVEVLACGSTESLDSLAEWLHEGPRMASVEGVQVTPVDDVERPAGFTIA